METPGMMIQKGFELAVTGLEELVEKNPAMTVAEVVYNMRHALDVVKSATPGPEPVGTCQHCKRPVVENEGRLTHGAPDGGVSNVGCRAASFVWNDGEGWDDSLDRTWKAQPSKR